jgi:hypothetical protein
LSCLCVLYLSLSLLIKYKYEAIICLNVSLIFLYVLAADRKILRAMSITALVRVLLLQKRPTGTDIQWNEPIWVAGCPPVAIIFELWFPHHRIAPLRSPTIHPRVVLHVSLKLQTIWSCFYMGRSMNNRDYFS